MKLILSFDKPVIEEVAQESDISLLINSNLDSLELTDMYSAVESCGFDIDISLKGIIGGGLESASNKSFLSKVWDKIKEFFDKICDYFRRGIEFVTKKFKRNKSNLDKSVENLKEAVNDLNEDATKSKKPVKINVLQQREERIKRYAEVREAGVVKLKFRKVTEEFLDDFYRFIETMSDKDVQRALKEREDIVEDIKKVLNVGVEKFVDDDAVGYFIMVFTHYTLMLNIWKGVCRADILEDNKKYTDLVNTASDTNLFGNYDNYKKIADEVVKTFEKPYVKAGKNKSLDYFTLDIKIDKAEEDIERFIRNRVCENGKFMSVMEYLDDIYNVLGNKVYDRFTIHEIGKGTLKSYTSLNNNFKNDGTVSKEEYSDTLRMAKLSLTASKVLSHSFRHVVNHMCNILGSIEDDIKFAIREIHDIKTYDQPEEKKESKF